MDSVADMLAGLDEPDKKQLKAYCNQRLRKLSKSRRKRIEESEVEDEFSSEAK